jgi:DNA-binding response OmpR family regulator
LRASPFDTVIIDAILRDGEGLETIRAIRKMAPDVPVIMLFGHHHQNRELAADDLAQMTGVTGIASSFQRPFAPADLIEAINRLTNDAPPDGGRGPTCGPQS